MIIETAETMEKLREKLNLRELDILENNLNITRIENGILGFTVPWIINTDSTGVIGGTGKCRISLHCRPGGTSCLEIHKLRNGDVAVAGYMRENDYLQLTSKNEGPLEFILLCQPFRNFTIPVSIPYDIIIESNYRDLDGKGILLDLCIN